MANILDRYGIKEVADVTFYALDTNEKPTYPVLYLDTLKVSTIEQTAEEATANGGKGNAPLIVWDYGKEITVTLEDALFSPKSLAIMFGDADGINSNATTQVIRKTVHKSQIDANGGVTINGKRIVPTTDSDKGTGLFYYNAKGESVQGTSEEAVYAVLVFQPKEIQTIDVSANSFPGTYYVTGDTYARNEANGVDEFFQFIVPKAKVQSENTITMEADGDPSVFNMSLKVLRPKDGVMMKLVKYDVDNTPVSGSDD